MTTYYPNSTKVRGEKRRSELSTEFIRARSTPVPECGCWLWTGAVSDGYGSTMFHGRSARAHRLSWEAHHGPIAHGLYVCHSCDVRSCVNPDHLFLGTHLENMADRDEKGRNKLNSMPGEKHPLAKLNESAVLDIRESAETGAALARKYGVSQSAICDIRLRRNWKHL